MRVTADKFFTYALENILNFELSVLSGYLGVKHNLKQKIT